MTTRYAHGLGRVGSGPARNSEELGELRGSCDELVTESSAMRGIVVPVTDYERARTQGICSTCGHFCGQVELGAVASRTEEGTAVGSPEESDDRPPLSPAELGLLIERDRRMRALLERLDRGEVALPQRAIRTTLNVIRDLEAGR